jgi:pimeloyl-ACP methyl ester carboxylesterase
MTEFLDIDGGRIAYDVTGEGPLVVLSPGMGDRRQAYRFLAPKLAQAGYRVATADLRGHGESSMGWKSVTGTEAITRTDIAGDLLALIRHLGGPAVIVGQSISGGAATIAAAKDPDLVAGIVEINPFTRLVKISLGGLVRIRRYRRGFSRLAALQVTHSLRAWLSYLDVAYPTKPADYADYMAALATLAASSAIPATVTADIPARPAPAIETIAYFCAAELIANATKHSYANQIKINIHTERSRVLRLEVTDDGIGGADASRGSGLAGLVQRVSTVDGRLDVSSPPGGPTVVTVVLPLKA